MSRNVTSPARGRRAHPRRGGRAALAAVAALALGLPRAAPAGEVSGTVRFTRPAEAPPAVEVTKDRRVCGEAADDESLLVSGGGLANVVVRVVVPGARVEPGRVTLDQRRCRFVPHVVVAPAGSTLEVLNGDPLLHGVHGFAGVATAFNLPTPEGKRRTHVLARPGVIRVECDVHAWMSAWVVVVDGPHFAVTDASGRFSIPGVPAGTYTAVAWHERLGERVASVTVPEAGAARLEVAYP